MRISVLILFMFLQTVSAQELFQSNRKLTKVTYEMGYNGNFSPEQNPIWLLANPDNALITGRDQMEGKLKYPFELTLVKPLQNEILRYAFLNSDENIGMKEFEAIDKQEFEFTDERKEILGYECKKAKTVINSNTIEIWYTRDAGVKGGPSVLGSSLGLVLEYVRNGNFVIRATTLQKEKINWPSYLKDLNPQFREAIDYRDEIWRSRFISLPLFSDWQINWSEEFDPRPDIMRFVNGTVAVRKVKFPQLTSADQIFVQLTEQSAGDAYDRTGSVFLIPTEKEISFLDALQQGTEVLPIYENGNGKRYQGITATGEYLPPLELMRFFTPFGVDHFNDRVNLKGKVWQDSVLYRQEITDYASMLSGKEVYIGAFIGNYDGGGHRVSAEITVHKSGEDESPLKKVMPLLNTLNVMEMGGQEYSTLFDVEEGLRLNFELDSDLKDAELRYITTGHGGWGQGDEFLPKKNTIFIDGKIVFEIIPWKEDCGSYRLYNPVSGNFSNGLSSSDLSRSNWCPGTVTNPYIIPLGNLEKGTHTLQIKIPQGEPEGSSFSAWNVSGVLTGYED